jgi:hypothetical protein
MHHAQAQHQMDAADKRDEEISTAPCKHR